MEVTAILLLIMKSFSVTVEEFLVELIKKAVLVALIVSEIV